MNNLKNKVQLIGHTGQAPEFIVFENGTQMAKVTMATNESYKNATGEIIKDTQWHNLVAWGKQAENFCKHVRKGTELTVEGKLITRTYETKTGDKRSITEIHINSFQVLNQKRSEEEKS